MRIFRTNRSSGFLGDVQLLSEPRECQDAKTSAKKRKTKQNLREVEESGRRKVMVAARRSKPRSARRRKTCDPENEGLYQKLVLWRQKVSRERNVKLYFVLPLDTLAAIAQGRPSNEKELLAVPGIGAIKLEQYGRQLLDLVAKH